MQHHIRFHGLEHLPAHRITQPGGKRSPSSFVEGPEKTSLALALLETVEWSEVEGVSPYATPLLVMGISRQMRMEIQADRKNVLLHHPPTFVVVDPACQQPRGCQHMWLCKSPFLPFAPLQPLFPIRNRYNEQCGMRVRENSDELAMSLIFDCVFDCGRFQPPHPAPRFPLQLRRFFE